MLHDLDSVEEARLQAGCIKVSCIESNLLHDHDGIQEARLHAG